MAEIGTQGSRPAPLATMARSQINKMRLRGTEPNKRMKRHIHLDTAKFHVRRQNVPFERTGFF